MTTGNPTPIEALEAIARTEAIDECIAAVRRSAWKHAGEDAHSQGMDAGARHQVAESIKALEALKVKP